MSAAVNSDIPLALPAFPQVQDRVLFTELMIVYDALRMLQQELSDAKARIAVLEANP